MKSNDYVATITSDQGSSFIECKDGTVKLPFGIEYDIFLLNKTDKGCIAKVYIDDENVTEGGLILKAGEELTLKGDTKNRKRFKFIEFDSEEARSAGKTDNSDKRMGVIRVEFYPEKVQQKLLPEVHYHHHHYPWIQPITPIPRRQPIVWDNASMAELRSCFTEPLVNTETNRNNDTFSDVGCTVPGQASGQEFVTSHLSVEPTPTVITLVLKGFHPVKVIKNSDNFYCNECGAHVLESAKFCSDCGSRVGYGS